LGFVFYLDIFAISYRYRIEFQKPIALHHYLPPKGVNRKRIDKQT